MAITTLFDFAYCSAYEDRLRNLAENLADKEQWNYSDSNVKTYEILRNYIEYTFRKLLAEKKVCYTHDNKFACFNTGLVTPNYEDIFAFFEEYKNPKPPHVTPFFFKGFLKKSESLVLKHFASNMPEVANYFEKPEELIFNPKCELIPDIDHIIRDNVSRFPAHLRNADDPEKRRQLIGAIDEVKMKVRTNYTIAVPQWYQGRIQLLLPLCLTPGSTNPDLALTATRINPTTYEVRTGLTLKMAYNNARLIVKPQSNWLKP